jgi:hypothetical protein
MRAASRISSFGSPVPFSIAARFFCSSALRYLRMSVPTRPCSTPRTFACSSRHSCRSRAQQPGGSSFWSLSALGDVERDARLLRDDDQRIALGVLDAEVAVVVEVSEDVLGDDLLLVGEVREVELPGEVVVERPLLDHRLRVARQIFGRDVAPVRRSRGPGQRVVVEVVLPVDLVLAAVAADLLGLVARQRPVDRLALHPIDRRPLGAVRRRLVRVAGHRLLEQRVLLDLFADDLRLHAESCSSDRLLQLRRHDQLRHPRLLSSSDRSSTAARRVPRV